MQLLNLLEGAELLCDFVSSNRGLHVHHVEVLF
jgi:hypothetical protein